MPAPPDFNKTLSIYLAVRDKADAKGECWYSLQNLADYLGCSRSGVRYHIKHLEKAGLISRDMARPHTDRPIRINFPNLWDKDELTKIISKGERISWQKRAAKAREDRELEMMDHKGNSDEKFRELPLTVLFAMLEDDILEEAVKVALESRGELPGRIRDVLNQAIDSHIRKVDGFRNARLAPTPVILRRVSELVQSSHRMAAPILRAWYETQQELAQSVTAELQLLDIPVRAPHALTEPLEVEYEDTTVTEALLACVEKLPDYDPNAVMLMLQLLSGKAVACNLECNEFDLEDDGEEELDLEDPDELWSSSEIGEVLSSTLSTLWNLPFSAPEWENVIPSFARSLSGITDTKQTQRAMASSVDALLEEIQSEYSNLLVFFQCEPSAWSVKNLVPAYTCLELQFQAVKLRELLAQYAPIYDRAPVVSDEMARAARRAELVPQILDATGLLQRIFGDPEVSDGGEDHQELEADTEPVCSAISSVQAESAAAAIELDNRNRNGEKCDTETPGSLDQETPAPACDIDGHILLLLSLQDLEQETDDLEHENAGLKEQVKALERRLYESRSQEENLRWAVAYRDNPGETEDTPELDSVGAAVALARERYPGQLLFQLNAESNADESSFKWPEQVWNALRWLATDYFTSHLGRNPIGDMDEACRSACGMWYKTSQHENTMTQFRDSYSTWVDGRRIWLGEHIGKGNSFDPRRTIRIAFDWDRQLQKVVIGYIGQHQRTSAA